MVPASKQRAPFLLATIAAVLAGVASLVGLVRQDLYAPFTLACAAGIPLSARFAARGSQRAWVLWAGQLVFLFYCYALYCFEGVYSVVLPLYVTIVACSLYATALFALAIEPAKLVPLRPSVVRPVAVFCAVLAVCFLAAWGGLLIGGIRAGARPAVGTVIILDLAIFMPAFAIAARGLWRGSFAASFLAPVLLVVAVGTCGSTMLGELISPLWGFPISWPMVVLFALFGPGSALLAWWALATPGAKQTHAVVAGG